MVDSFRRAGVGCVIIIYHFTCVILQNNLQNKTHKIINDDDTPILAGRNESTVLFTNVEDKAIMNYFFPYIFIGKVSNQI